MTNLRFADDVLIFAKTLDGLVFMLSDLQETAAQFGLELHLDKTKLLSNLKRRVGRNARKNVAFNGMTVEVVPFHGHAKYLGRMMTFGSFHSVELDNRIACA